MARAVHAAMPCEGQVSFPYGAQYIMEPYAAYDSDMRMICTSLLPFPKNATAGGVPNPLQPFGLVFYELFSVKNV